MVVGSGSVSGGLWAAVGGVFVGVCGFVETAAEEYVSAGFDGFRGGAALEVC